MSDIRTTDPKPRASERHAHFSDIDEEMLAMSARDAVRARQRRIRGRDAPVCV
jgi:hypothetical protein